MTFGDVLAKLGTLLLSLVITVAVVVGIWLGVCWALVAIVKVIQFF